MPEMTILQAIELALQHHQAGRLSEAEAVYRQVLAVDPQQFDALQLLGLLATQTGHHAAAVELMSRALAINNSIPSVHANLAGAFRALGQVDRALAHAETA